MSAQCNCGNQDLTYKSGTSKATGKQWQGWKCEPCDIMYGMDGKPWGAKGSKPNYAKKPSNTFSRPSGNAAQPQISIEKKLDEILEILHENFGEKAPF